MNQEPRFFYLQDRKNRSVVCVAHQPKDNNHEVYAVSTWATTRDLYDRSKARFVAQERLQVMPAHNSGIVHNAKGGNVKMAILNDIVKRKKDFCQRTHDAALLWWNIQETTEGQYKINSAVDSAARLLRTACKGQATVLRRVMRQLSIKVFEPGKQAAKPVVTKKQSPFSMQRKPIKYQHAGGRQRFAA